MSIGYLQNLPQPFVSVTLNNCILIFVGRLVIIHSKQRLCLLKVQRLLNLHILYRLFRDTLTLLKEVGLDYLFIHVNGCVALRNKEFHLKPTPLRDSRYTFLFLGLARYCLIEIFYKFQLRFSPIAYIFLNTYTLHLQVHHIYSRYITVTVGYNINRHIYSKLPKRNDTSR